MNRDQKAAVIDEVAGQITEAGAVFAIDYRGLSVTQAVELRERLGDAGATFRVVKNRLTLRAADKAGAESLKELLEGPTAFTFAHGDAAVAAKAIATFRREHGLLEFKGGTMDGEPLSAEEVESISRLPARDVLQGQFVGVLAAPVTGLVRGLGSLLQGVALQLGQIQEQGLLAGGGDEAADTAAGDNSADGDSDGAADEAGEAETQDSDEGDDDAPEAADTSNDEEE